MQSLIKQIFETLVSKGNTVATAESCTSGMLAMELTRLPGSSDIFVGGVNTYSNFAKETLLAIDESMISANGAVSGLLL